MKKSELTSIIREEIKSVLSEDKQQLYIALKKFNINDLDPLEERFYNDFRKHSSKEEALEILINMVEGDFSQLNPKLAKIAKKYWE